MKHLIFTLIIGLFGQQAFASGLNAAFEAALANSEVDHKKQQVAFEVEPDQVEKATFRKNLPAQKLKPEVSTFAIDIPTSIKEVDVDTEEVKDEAIPQVDELAQMGQEIDDFN